MKVKILSRSDPHLPSRRYRRPMLLSPLPPLANSYEITGWLCGEFLEIAGCVRMIGSLDVPWRISLRFVRMATAPFGPGAHTTSP